MIKLSTNKILIPVDFSDNSLLAVKHAAFLAERTKGELLLVHVVKQRMEHFEVIGTSPSLDPPDGAVGKMIERKLADLAADIRKQYGVPSEITISHGSIATEIVNVANDQKAALIVMGTHGYSRLEEILLGSNALSVLHKAACPVLTIRLDSDHMYERIVAPLDMSEHSRQKMGLAIDLAAKYGAKLFIPGILGSLEEDDKGKMEVVLDQIEKMAKKAGVPVSSAIITRSKNRSYDTLKYAKEVKANLVVIMSDQESEFSGLLLGPYAHQVINHAPMPVLCIKPEERGELMSWTNVGGFAT
jgi:nucleotide-binding universal stress UspA family protein